MIVAQFPKYFKNNLLSFFGLIEKWIINLMPYHLYQSYFRISRIKWLRSFKKIVGKFNRMPITAWQPAEKNIFHNSDWIRKQDFSVFISLSLDLSLFVSLSLLLSRSLSLFVSLSLSTINPKIYFNFTIQIVHVSKIFAVEKQDFIQITPWYLY